ncbi:MAG: hypothetical protein RLN76_05875 [Phycisphaeraceae bacterium]
MADKRIGQRGKGDHDELLNGKRPSCDMRLIQDILNANPEPSETQTRSSIRLNKKRVEMLLPGAIRGQGLKPLEQDDSWG